MKTPSLIALLICAAAIPASAGGSRSGYDGSGPNITAGHAMDQTDWSPDVASLDRQKQHQENAHIQTVKPVEGQTSVSDGRKVVFRKGSWHYADGSAGKPTEPTEGLRGTYEGRKLIFHQGKWYYDVAASPSKVAKAASGH